MTYTNIGRYEIHEELHQTGIACVFHGMDPDFNQEVVIKLLPPQLLTNPRNRILFEHEAQIIALINQPGIVSVQEIGQHEDSLFLTMPYLPGGSLADKLAEGPLAPDEALHITQRLAEILDSVHATGTLHLDLKPNNILFDEHDEPYVSDFGMLKFSGNDPQAAITVVLGAPGYSSPEQMIGEQALDERCDVYAIGAILYEMLAGMPYFAGATATEHILSSFIYPLPDLLSDNPNVPVQCVGVVEKALARNREERYSSVLELAEALAMALEPNSQNAGKGKKREKKEQKEQAGIPRRKNGFKILAIGTLLLALIASGVVSIPYLTGSPSLSLAIANYLPKTATATAWSPAIPTQILPAVLPTSGTTPTLQVQKTEAPISVPTEAEEANIPTEQAPPPVDSVPGGITIGGADKLALIDANDIWIVNLDGSDLDRITDDGGEKENLRWAPDGVHLVYSIQGAVKMVNTLTREVIPLGTFADFAFAPDMTSVIVGGRVEFDNKVYKWLNFRMNFNRLTLKNTKLTKNTTCGFEGGRMTQFSPSGSHFATIVQVSIGSRQYEQVQVFEWQDCGKPPRLIDAIPGVRFSLRAYSGAADQPLLFDYGWDGKNKLAVNGNVLNGYGDLVLYDISTGNERVVNPLVGKCCYSDLRFSPDGQYLLFAFQDLGLGTQSKLYYISLDSLGTGAIYEPLPLPFYFFRDPREHSFPALRSAAP